MFILDIQKNIAKITETEPVTSGSQDVYLVQFNFSEEWDDLRKIAVFRAGSIVKHVLLDTTNLCFIPWEVMVDYDVSIEMGVYGTYGGHVVLPTIWAPTVVILEGVILGDVVKEPTPELYEQILAEMEALKNGILPPGGQEGQLLSKSTDDDYDAVWIDPPDTGINFTTDDTLKMTEGDENVLRVTTPVKGVTQAEYDRLGSNQKKNVLYVITDAQAGTVIPGGGGGSVANMTPITTDEIDIIIAGGTVPDTGPSPGGGMTPITQEEMEEILQ